jgi:ActR/RegA family two-component response regulator
MTSPHGSVLLADDEEGILKTLGRALREDGHAVVATAPSTCSWWTTGCPAAPAWS